MKNIKKLALFSAALAMTFTGMPQLEAVTYVTDTGGYAYDESRAATNLAPAIALGTVAIVGIIAIAVQNSNGDGSSATSNHSHCCSHYKDPSTDCCFTIDFSCPSCTSCHFH
ncbi:MAG: hypothetical protein H0V82_06940 [Candidatus Protochlamydia sp.]|nr:hypothetical protein [Candidatus Protochlamydia sp.]